MNHSVTVGRRDWGFVSGSRLMISLRVWSLSWGQMWKTRAQIGLVEWSSGDGVVGVVVAWYLMHVERCVFRSDSRRNMLCVQLLHVRMVECTLVITRSQRRNEYLTLESYIGIDIGTMLVFDFLQNSHTKNNN